MLVLIPARGGSKGLPGKNIRDFCGKPLLAHAIDCARASCEVTRVVVSTDCPQIAKVALDYGAECPSLRPARLALDESPAIDTYLYTLEQVCCDAKSFVNELIVLLPTAPLRLSADVDEAISLYRQKEASSVASFVETHPASWLREVNDEGQILAESSDLPVNRQNYGNSYVPNGAIYIFSRSILAKRLYYDNNSYAYLMPKSRSIDIDDIDDFEVAEALFYARKKRGSERGSD